MLIIDCDSKHKIVLDYFGDEEDCTKLHEELKRNSNIGYYFAWTDNSNVDARMVNCEVMPLAIANENVYLNPVAFAKAGKNELRALCNARPQYYREEVIENLVSSHINPALDEKAAPIALADVIENISRSLFDAKDIQVLPSFRDGEVNLKVGNKDLVGKVKFGRGIGDNSVSINSSMYLELKEKEGEVVPYQAELLEPDLIAITLSNGGIISFAIADFEPIGGRDEEKGKRAYDSCHIWYMKSVWAEKRWCLDSNAFSKEVINTVRDYARKIDDKALLVFVDELTALEDRFEHGDFPATVIAPYYIRPSVPDKEASIYASYPPRKTIKIFYEI